MRRENVKIGLLVLSLVGLVSASLSIVGCNFYDDDSGLMGGQDAEITGRISMGPKDPNQCQLPYSGNERVRGLPIAGVDGATFGAKKDGVIGSACGKCISIKGQKFIIVDRVWENDGPGGEKYKHKGDADSKRNGSGKGSRQIDISADKFREFGGHNFKAPFKIVGC